MISAVSLNVFLGFMKKQSYTKEKILIVLFYYYIYKKWWEQNR
jgi:hypothetical protein